MAANIVQQTAVYGFADNIACPAFASAVTQGDAIAAVAYTFILSLAASNNFAIGDGTANTYNLALIVPVSGGSFPITFTAPPTGTSGTLTTGWAGTAGANSTIVFSNGQISKANVTNGATSASWTTPISGTPTVNATGYNNINVLAMWLVTNSVGGTVTPAITATGGGTVALYAAEITNVATSALLLGATGQEQFSPGTGTNALTSGVVTVSQSAVLFGFCVDLSAVTANNPVGGVGYNAQPGVWNSGTYLTGMGEDLSITSSTAALFTAGNAPGADTYFVAAMALAKTVSSPLLLGQICL